jgi:hypothetical protein
VELIAVQKLGVETSGAVELEALIECGNISPVRQMRATVDASSHASEKRISEVRKCQSSCSSAPSYLPSSKRGDLISHDVGLPRACRFNRGADIR